MIPTNPTLPATMVAAVSKKLNLTDGVLLDSWKRNTDGSHTPVFIVPATHAERARELGLSIKA
jgi:hypothetical protein